MAGNEALLESPDQCERADGSNSLANVLAGLHETYYPHRRALEMAIGDACIAHMSDLPIAFNYRDAVEAARQNGWLRTMADGKAGVVVDLGEDMPEDKKPRQYDYVD